MGLYKNNNGVLSPIAGRGKAEYGASTVRKGTATYTGAAVGSYPAINVTFDTPMPDADYEIFFDYDEASGHGELNYMGYFGVYKRTANGFQIVFSAAATIDSGWNVKYTAFKLYTDNEYNNLLTLSRPDLWPANTEIDFGNGLYGQRFVGTAAKTTFTNGGMALVSGVSTTACVFNSGGMIDMSGTSGTNWYNVNGSWDNANGNYRSLFTNTSNVLRFYCGMASTVAATVQYNFWITYTK